MANAQKWLDRQKKKFSRASNVDTWVVAQDSVDVWKAPAAGNILRVNEALAVAQLAERISEEGLEASSREPAETFLGRFDHVDVPITLHPRPPAALAGSSVPQEDVLLQGVFGARKFTNSQAAEDITAVVSHDRDTTVIEIADSLSDWSTLPHAVRFVSNNTSSADAAGLYLVTAASEPTSGTVRLTLADGLPRRPVITGTADQIQGVTLYYDDGTDIEDTLYSLLVKSGTQVFAMKDGLVNDLQCGRDARGLLTFTMTYQGRRLAWRAGEDQVRGNGSIDGISDSELTFAVGNASKFTAGARLTLKFIDVATDAVLGTEGSTTPLEVSSVDKVNNTITVLARGDGARSAGNLTVETSGTQETAGTYDVSSTRYLRLSIDNRPFVTIDLQSPTAPSTPAAATASELVANINDTLRDDPNYGQWHEGRGGKTVAWDSVAGATGGGAVHLASQTWGSQSRIQVESTGLATSAHAVVFSGAFDIAPDDEVQIVPWTPGGSVTLSALHNKRGMPSIDGHQFKGYDYQLTYSNAYEWVEDVVNLDGYADGAIPAGRKENTAQVSTLGYGWTDELETLAEDDGTHFVAYRIGTGVGNSYAFFMEDAKIGTVDPGGDNRREKTVAIAPQKPTTTNNKAIMLAVG